MSGRFLTVGLQAVGVAVIAAIIFVAFLRPEDPESLSGIEAPGEEESIVDAKPSDEPRKKKRGSNGEGRFGNDKGESQRGSQGGNNGAATGTGDDQTFDADTPPADQYDDLVTRLMIRVGEPSVFREIDAEP